MPSSNSLAKRLGAKYPGLKFEVDESFRWSPRTQTVYYRVSASKRDLITLLHETAHGVLGHSSFSQDVALLGLERDAWTLAQELAPDYDLLIDTDTIETALDSYRDWLYARSTCPNCSQTGLQTKEREYTCLGCNTLWSVNDARQCGLKRYQMSRTTK